MMDPLPKKKNTDDTKFCVRIYIGTCKYRGESEIVCENMGKMRN